MVTQHDKMSLARPASAGQPERTARATVARDALVRRLVLVSLASLWLTTALLVGVALWVNGGQFVYTLDDPYIHLAMARNLALHGSYGVEPGVYSSASSSPAWTALLGLLALALPPALLEWAPLALNLAAGTLVLPLLLRAVARDWPAVTTRWQAAVATLAAVGLPLLLYLPGLAFIGMEHTPHLLLSLGFVLLATATDGPRRHLAPLAVLAALLPLTRPEGLLLVGVTGLWLLLTRQWRPAVVLGAAALAPLAGLAVINLLHGEGLLPNSVLAKSAVMPETGEAGWRYLARAARVYLQRWSAGLGYDGGLLALAVAVVALAAFQRGQARLNRRAGLVAVLFLGTLLAHATVATMGWFERYQAYLILLGGLALLLLLGPAPLQPRPLTRWLLVGLLGLGLALPPLFFRQLYDLAFAWKASNNIYHQQYQMGRFLRAAYPTDPVAANDIGAVSYLRPGPLLDLYGLGARQVLALRQAGRYDAAALDQLVRARGIQVAIIYDSFFPVSSQGSVGSRPAHWRRVATWELGGIKITPSNRLVSFYATGDPAAADRLRQALRDFERQLPAGVTVRYDP